MDTVKYTGPVASFHCPTSADIRSLKVHFSPKQEGTGDPSPENVRPIIGWDGVETYQCGKNIGKVRGFSATALQSNNSTRQLTNNYGTTLNTVDYNLPDTSLIITQSQAPETTIINSYKNGYVCVILDNLIYGETYKVSFKITNIISNPLDATLTNLRGMSPVGNSVTPQIINNDTVCFTVPFREGYSSKYKAFELRICGMSFTMSEFMVTTADVEDRTFEPYRGSTTNYTFGVLGKNKLNADAEQQAPDNTNMMPTNKRIFTPDTYCVGMSWSNYYVPNNVTSYSVSNGTITVTNGNVYGLGYPVRVAPGQAYHLSATTTNGRAHVAYFAADGTYISGVSTNILNSSFTVPNDVKTAVIIFYSNSGEATFSNIQLELGSTATTYEPYNPNHTVYGGWVDLISGEVCEEWWKILIPSSLSSIRGGTGGFVDNTGYQGETWTHRYFILSKQLSQTKDVVSDKLVKGNCGNSAWKWGFDGAGLLHYSLGNESIGVTAGTSASDRDVAVSNWLTNNPITLVYQLATPNTYSLAPTQLQTFLGTNNVWSNADYVEVEYDLHETQDILARKNFIMASQPHVEEASGAIATFNTDMAAKLKECKVYFKPKQDLHGYSKPWVGGGGKNIAKPYDNSYVSSTYISFDYSAANGTFRCYGTASASSTHSSPSATNAVNNGATFTLPAGTYTLSIIDGDGANIYAQCVSSDETVLAETTSYIIFTTNESLTVFVRLKVAAAATVDKTVKIQLEKGSSATAYEPYENICPISGWNGCEAYAVGKNLIDESYLADANNYPNSGSYGYYYTNDIQLVPNTRYRFVWYDYDSTELSELGTTNIYLYVSGANEYIVNNANYRQYSSGFITPATGIIRLGIYHPSSLQRQDVLDAIFNNGKLLLQIGVEDTSHEPYTGTAIPIDWTDSAGTIYGGYVDLVSGEVVQEWNTIDMGTPTWVYNTNNNAFVSSVISNMTSMAGRTGNWIFVCSGYASNNDNFSTMPDMSVSSSYQTRARAIHCRDSRYTDPTVFREAVTGVKIAYPLETPIHYQIDPQTLKSLRGINNIWSNSNGDIQVKFWKH